jgi:hypothetical protein
MDVIPVDYAAESLRHLLLKPTLQFTSYHIASGDDACSTWRDIAATFARSRVAVPQLASTGGGGAQEEAADTLYQTVGFDDIVARRHEFDALFGPCNKKFMLAALRLYAGFSELNTVFDPTRLRAEGMPASPRFVDYLPVCESTSARKSIAEQGTIDFA